MIPTHNEHIRFERQDAWNEAIHLFDGLHLPVKITQLAEGIGLIDVDVKEIIIPPICLQSIKLSWIVFP
jgi:hypothetical protein